jgi:hypothetical protein
MNKRISPENKNCLFSILSFAALILPFLGTLVFNAATNNKKTVDPISIDENYQNLFEGRIVKNANSYGTEGTDYTADLTYRVNDASLSACVSKVGATDTSIVIPYYYSDGTTQYTVTAIDYSGFANCPNLTSVTFQTVGGVSGANNITLMDAQCFASCPNLSSFNSTVTGRFVIPSNIEEIHSASFMNCQSMLSLIVDKTANKLGAIDDNAFNGCISWNTALSLNKHTAGFTIGEAAFANCILLPQAILRTGVTSIGASAFYNDYSLKIIGIPSTCTTMGEEVFRRCTSATTAYIGSAYRYQTNWPNGGGHATDSNDDNSDYTSLQKSSGTCVEGDWNYASSDHAIKIIVNKDDISISPDNNYSFSTTPYSIAINSVTKTLFRITIIQYLGTNQATVVVPDSWEIDPGDSTSWLTNSEGNAEGVVTEIATGAFNDATIESLTLPCTLEKIDSNAFAGCTGIKNLTFSETKTNNTFTSYFTAYIDNVSTNINIGTYATAGTDNDFALTGLVTISDYAFSNSCSAITTLVIPHTVQTIGTGAFANYSSSTYSSGLPYLKTLTFNMYSDNTSCLLQIAPYAFYKMGESLATADKGQCDLVLPSSMTGNSTNSYIIGAYAFFNCYNLGTLKMGLLTKSSTSTAGYTKNIIQNYAFDYCSNLKWAYIGNGVYQIAGSAFADCTAMDWIYISGTVGSSASRVDSSIITNNTHCVAYFGCTGTNLSSKFSIGDQTIYYGHDDKGHSMSNTFSKAPDYYGIYGMKGITNVTTWGAYYIYTYDGSLETTNAGVQMYYTTNSSQWTITKGLTYVGNVASNVAAIGNNIVTIGAKSFYKVSNITSLIVTNTVTSIQEYAFCYASGLTSFGYTGATTSCPTTLTSIAQYAFSFSGLTSLTIDAAIQTLGNSATASGSQLPGAGNCFFGCEALEDLNMSSTTGKATGSSYYCDNSSTIGALYTYTTSGSTTTYVLVMITGSASGHNSGSTTLGTYTIIDGTVTIGSWSVVTCKLTALIIPSSVTTISDYAFHMFSADPGGPTTGASGNNTIMAATLTSITFVDKTASKCTYIGTGAYAYQTALTTIEMPDKSGNTIQLGQYTFRCCSALTSFTFPTNAKIDNEATDSDNYYKLSGYQFDRCYYLNTVTIPASINYLGTTVFWGCDQLSQINWTDIKYIANEAFSQCYNLTTIPAFSASLTYIGSKAFYMDNKLSAVDFSACKNLTTIGSNAFDQCYTLQSVDLSKCTSLTSIGDSAFVKCTGITSATYAPNITTINSSVFNGCSSLVTFTGSSSLTTINSSAFSGDTSLTTVTGISNVTYLGDNAFNNCQALTTMTSVSKVQTVGASCFYQCYGFVTLSDFTNLITIGDKGFQGCKNLVTMVLPSASLTTIGSYAFGGCYSLKETTAGSAQFIIPNSVNSIGTYAFNNCSGLLYVKYSSGMTSIPDNCFSNCTKLVSFVFNNTQITSIGNNAFQNDSALANSTGSSTDTVFTLPNSVSTLGTSCFNKCTSLVNFNIGSSSNGSVLAAIPNNCFQGDIKLVQVVFNTGSSYMTSIGQYAFDGCKVLSNTGTSKLSSGANCFSLPDSVATILQYAFQNCNAISNLYIGSGISNMGQYIISGNTSLVIYINLSYSQVTTFMSSTFDTKWYNFKSYYCSSTTGNKPTGCKGYYSTNTSGLITGVTAA